jgi:Ecdysteroid kinase-like family
MIHLSENECNEIVKISTKNENVKIEKLECEPFGEELGFLGEYFRLKISAKVNNSLKVFQFFVKSLPIRDTKHKREMLIETGIFLKEVKIYKFLIAKFHQISNEFWCPHVFLLRDDLIVFNDMTLLGYETLPSYVIDFTQDCVESTLNALASFHSCSIVYERQNSIKDEFEDILFETSVADIQWFTVSLQAIQKIAIAKNFLSANQLKHKAFYEKMFNIIDVMETPVNNVPNVLCHRDIWKNNLMFNKDHSHCVLIDFQTVRYLSLTIDVLMAIICTTRPDHYEKKISHYIKFYYKELQSILTGFKIDLNSVMSFESFQLSCDFYKQFAIVYRAIVVMQTQIPPELFKDLTNTDFVNFETDKFPIIAKFMRKAPLYDEVLTEAVQKIVNHFDEI